MKPQVAMMNRKSLALLASALLVLVACRKDKDKDEVIDLDYTSASDNARSEDAFSDMLTEVDKAVDANGLRDMEDACDPTVTFDTIANPHTITIDFGTVNCTSNNGRQRRGRLLVSYTGHYREPGTVITITPDNYYVNDNHLQGTKTVTNLGENSDGHLQYSVVADGTLTAADGSWTATHHAERTRTWIEGEDTQTRSDDVYLITGGGTGVNRNGDPYTSTITTALRIAANCPFIEAGTIQIERQDRPMKVINWGDTPSCDGTFTVTVNGHTFTVTIG